MNPIQITFYLLFFGMLFVIPVVLIARFTILPMEVVILLAILGLLGGIESARSAERS